MLKIGFFPAHPSQFWMMKALYESAPSNVIIHWYIRDKDVTKELIDNFGFPYTLVSKAQTGYLGNAIELAFNVVKFIKFTKRDKIDLWLSKYGSVNISAWLLRVANISFNDDDADIVPLIAYTSYPFANKVLCTNWTRMANFKHKTIFYPSFHELFYLHPKRFIKNTHATLSSLNLKTLDPYIIIRLSALEAHHDAQAKGVSDELLIKIIQKFKTKYRIYISSEKKLPPHFSSYQLKISANEIHNILAHASICIADSQTMIAEAAVLGIPCLRISSFSKKIGYLNELERRGLCKSLTPDSNLTLKSIDSLLTTPSEERSKKIALLHEETIDPIAFFWKVILANSAKNITSTPC